MREGRAHPSSEENARAPEIARFLAGYITEAEYAAQRGVSVRTCQRDRQLRQAPPYVLIGRQVFYRVDALRVWLIAHERNEDRQVVARRRAISCSR